MASEEILSAIASTYGMTTAELSEVVGVLIGACLDRWLLSADEVWKTIVNRAWEECNK